MITLEGEAADDTAVQEVRWQINGSPFRLATGTTSWSAVNSAVPLTPGTNLIRVLSFDTSGNRSKAPTRHVFYSVPNLFTLLTNGIGTVAPSLGGQNLEIGRAYTLSARPALG